jgi:ABC-type branched-subunit amino acid transport system ATPase component/ABC-type branched-subunit amino acid transport system permease subunit
VTGQTQAALRGAAAEARASWTRVGWIAVAALLAAAVVPFVLPGSVRMDGLAETGYLALAAVGLGFAVGAGGMPSVAQGAFVGLGAVVAAHLAGSGWGPVLAAVAGAVVAGAGGVAVGAAIVRFRPVYVAAATWIATWLFALVLDAFPSISGGASGLVVSPVWTPTVHYELAVGLVALAALVHWTLTKSSFGLSLRAAAARPAAAAALGVEAPRLRLQAFAGAAAIGGLAGGFAVQLVGVADPGAYGPFLSFKLLVAVLVGGAASAVGPAVGIVTLGGLTLAAETLGDLSGAETARFGPMLAALLLLAVLTAGGEGVVPLVSARFRRQRETAAVETAAAGPPGGGSLAVRDLRKRFGGLVALDRFDLSAQSGKTLALIGPNGSGKTTALRLLAGTLSPDEGRIELDGTDVTNEPAQKRVRRGLVRTLQANAVFPGLTALENALVGASVRRRFGGAFRTLVATPKARAEDRETRARAHGALATVGLGNRAAAAAESLTTAEQRLLMLASALATEPRALLVDEPSAGAGTAELERLTRVLAALREQGLAVVVVEHNLRLVRSLADEVVVLDAGSTLATGPPDEVADDPAVRAAYLGRQPL